MVSDTSSITHFNHSWQKLIQEEFLHGPPMQHILLLLLLLLLLLFKPKIFLKVLLGFWYFVLMVFFSPSNLIVRIFFFFLIANRHLKTVYYSDYVKGFFYPSEEKLLFTVYIFSSTYIRRKISNIRPHPLERFFFPPEPTLPNLYSKYRSARKLNLHSKCKKCK